MDKIKDWMVTAFIVVGGGLIVWGGIRTQLSEHDSRLTRLEAKQDTMITNQALMGNSISEIKAKVDILLTDGRLRDSYRTNK